MGDSKGGEWCSESYTDSTETEMVVVSMGRSMNTIIACFSVALINTMTKSNLREVIFYLMEDNILSSTSK